MAQIYYRLIKMNAWTIEQVPSLWKEQVQALLDAEQE